MGRIFGISDLPVSTIMTPFSQVQPLERPTRLLLADLNNEASVKYPLQNKGLIYLKRFLHKIKP